MYEPPVEVFELEELADVDELVELLLELLEVLLEEELSELDEPETFKFWFTRIRSDDKLFQDFI